jgi:DNA-nicking Smr family endonuclease
MSKARGSGGGSRTSDPEDADLWAHTAQKIDRVKLKPRVPTAETPAAKRPPATKAGARSEAKDKSSDQAAKPARAAAAPRPPRPTQVAPPLADVDRRKVRQIALGKIAIDAKIDLHGDRQRDARTRLRGFLVDAQARGCRTVLVVTGKGGSAAPDRLGVLMGEAQRGVLRHNVPHWLSEPDLRAIVLGYTQAAPNHGGAGALYVQLRKGGAGG